MAFKVSISSEYKDHKSGKYRVKRVKSGSYFFGEIREYKGRKVDGKQLRVYWSARLAGEEQSKDALWAFDKNVMLKMKTEGVCLSHVGVLVTLDPKRKISDPALLMESWLTSMELFDTHRTGYALAHRFFSRAIHDIDETLKVKMLRLPRGA